MAILIYSLYSIGGGWIGQALRITIQSSQGFKQVSTRSIQVRWGINAWNTFVLRVEHPYIVRKLEKSLDMGEPTFHAEKLHPNQSACFSFSTESDDFTEHYIIRLLSVRACPAPRV